jgi:hypothetical protein
VLAGKGPLRRAKTRRALAGCAPLWRLRNRDGRLRRDQEEEAGMVGLPADHTQIEGIE